MILELKACPRSDKDDNAVQSGLELLLEEAKTIGMSKQQPPSKLIGDWQSTETLYSVVDRRQFNQWREHVNRFLQRNFEDSEALCYGFNETCRFPQYMEFIEGQKFLNQLKRSMD